MSVSVFVIGGNLLRFIDVMYCQPKVLWRQLGGSGGWGIGWIFEYKRWCLTIYPYHRGMVFYLKRQSLYWNRAFGEGGGGVFSIKRNNPPQQFLCQRLSWILLRGTNFYSCQDPTDDTRNHGDVIKWKHFPRYCLFVRGIHRSPVNSPHKKGQ